MKNNFTKSLFTLFSIILCLLIFGGIIGCGESEPLETTETESTASMPESSEPETETLSESERKSQYLNSLLSQMTLDEKIYQLFIVTPEQLTNYGVVTQAGEATRSALENRPVGGLIYFKQNLLSTEQCIQLTTNTQSYAKINLFLATDEEGGTVSRLGNNPSINVTTFSSMQTIGASGDSNQAYNVGLTLGKEMRALGFNVDFAPVSDVNSNPQNPIIGVRSFGSTPELVSSMVSSCVQGFKESNLICTLKHFPGHGDSSTDSHLGDVVINKTKEQLYACELQPFIAGIQAGAPFIMTGHLVVPSLTSDNLPATLSYNIITNLLRNELGYEGIIITDAMNMKAISSHFDSAEAAVRAIEAGNDIILIPVDLEYAVQGIKNALATGRITETRINESVMRILKTKYEYQIIQ